MHLDIEFSPEIESALSQRAAAEGVDVPTFVQALVAERLTAEASPPVRHRKPHAEFMNSLREIIDLHAPSKGIVDDSRESIYAGRG